MSDAAGPNRRTIVRWALVVAASLVTAVVFIVAGGDEDVPRPDGLIDVALSPQLPDLIMEPLTIPGIGVTEDGRWILRIGAIISNIGDGDFLVRGVRRGGDWEVLQRVQEPGGVIFTERVTDAEFDFGSDAHDHWHVRDMETHWIETLDGVEIGRVVKQGYCFFDTTDLESDLPLASSEPTYSSLGCGEQSSREVLMGLSVGWGDDYPWSLFDQNVDVTGLELGRYRVRATADPFGWFDELDESNNDTWSIIEVTLNETGLPVVTVVEEAT